MTMFGCKILPVAVVLIGLVELGACIASAQDTYKVNYFDNGRLGDTASFSKVRIDHPGLTETLEQARIGKHMGVFKELLVRNADF